MTNEELVNQITAVAEDARKENMFVNVNPNIPSVAIYLNEDQEYFFQYEEAEELLDEAMAAESTYLVNIEDYILWSAQGW